MTTAATTPAGDDRAIPPRFRWLRRLIVGTLIWLLVLLGFRWWLVYRADAAFERASAQLRATGVPVSRADFESERIPPEANMHFWLRRAAQTFQACRLAIVQRPHCDRCVNLNFSLATLPDLCEVRFDCVAHYLADNAAALQDFAEAARRSQYWNPIDPRLSTGELRHGIWNLPAISLSLVTRLQNVLAMHTHAAGDDATAVVQLSDGLRVASACAADVALTSVVHSSRTAHADALTTILTIAPELRIGVTDGAAQPDRVRELIAQLLDEARLERALRDVLLYQRMLVSELTREARIAGMARSARPPAQPTWPQRAVAFLEAPVVVIGRARSIRMLDQALAALAVGGIPAAARALDDARAAAASTSGVDRASRLFDWYPQAALTLSSMCARQRIAAALLAARLYEAEVGALPASPEALTPAYLPKLPADPFNPSAALNWIATGDEILIYSIGPDGLAPGTLPADVRALRKLEVDGLLARCCRRAAPVRRGDASDGDRQPNQSQRISQGEQESDDP